MRQITLRAMRFHALVGILPQERETLQPIEIDLCVSLDDRATNTAVLDYRALYDLTARVFTTGAIDYLEEIGERVAGAALALDSRIRLAHVAVRKPHVSLGGPLAYAEVVTELAAR